MPNRCPASARRSDNEVSSAGMSTRSSSPAPLRGPSAAAISVGAVAELELLTPVAPARVVAADLLAVRLHDGELGLPVIGQALGHSDLAAAPPREGRRGLL